jgi:hypothetical protein
VLVREPQFGQLMFGIVLAVLIISVAAVRIAFYRSMRHRPPNLAQELAAMAALQESAAKAEDASTEGRTVEIGKLVGPTPGGTGPDD